jgi:hypothetical protein
MDKLLGVAQVSQMISVVSFRLAVGGLRTGLLIGGKFGKIHLLSTLIPGLGA